MATNRGTSRGDQRGHALHPSLLHVSLCLSLAPPASLPPYMFPPHIYEVYHLLRRLAASPEGNTIQGYHRHQAGL